jgi:hypothetical protein
LKHRHSAKTLTQIEAVRLKGSNEKVIRETDRAQMSGMQWHRISDGNAAGEAQFAKSIRSSARTAVVRDG